jgi:hypothetical protein
MMPKRAAAATFALLLTTTAVLAAGCARSTPAGIPSGITVNVFQNRLDYSPRILEIEVNNATDDPFTVTDASFVSTRFTSIAEWASPEQIPAGAARDLKVHLPAPLCDSTPPSDTVSLLITLKDGTRVAGAVMPSDDGGSIEAINNQDCLVVSVNAIAAVTPPTELLWTPGARQPATVTLTVTPTGVPGTLTINYVKGTVLLGLVDPAGVEVYDIERDQIVDATSGVSFIPLLIVPGRCDAHAIIEDKRGTFMPLDVQTNDGRSGKIYIAMSDNVRRSIYEYYQDYCGFGN